MHLAQFKTTMKMDILHGKTVQGVLKELTIANLRQNPCTIDHSRIDEESYF